MYEAFEKAYAFEQPNMAIDLRDQLVNPAIAHMANLFVSSQCRTCYKGRQKDAAWRRSCFHTILPLISKISQYQATILLERTALDNDAPLPDVFKLGFMEEDVKIYNALRRQECLAFQEELKSFQKSKGHTTFDGHQSQQCGTPANSPAQATELPSNRPSIISSLQATP